MLVRLDAIVDNTHRRFHEGSGGATSADLANLVAMTSGAITLPRKRRLRPPPKLLIYLVSTYCVCMGWIGDSAFGIAAGHSSPFGDAVYLVMALVWARRSLVLRALLRRAMRAYEDGKLLWSPRYTDWAWLAFSALFMVVVAVDIAAGH